jgi:predicted HAD superfamily Cof-like phosphohydrolase
MMDTKEDIVDEAERRLRDGAVYPGNAGPGEQDDFGDVADLVKRLVAEVNLQRAHVVEVARVGKALTEANVRLIEAKCAEIERLRASTIRAQVSEFHRVYEQEIGDKPAVPSDEVVRLRVRLIAEEFCEMLEAIYPVTSGAGCWLDDVRSSIVTLVAKAAPAPDLPELVDAWGDLAYVIEGSNLAFGVDSGPVVAAIHAANMAKLGPDGKPLKRADGKIIKPSTWSPPDIASELRKQGWHA